MEIRTLVFILVLCLLYMLGGAGLFMAIESQAEIQRQTLILQTSCTSRADLLAFLDFIHKDLEIARYVMRANHTANVMWDFAGAFSFVESLVTTIGYGHIVPRTTLGRFTCVVYALLGVPLMMACLSAVGEKLCQVSKRWRDCRIEGFSTAATQRRIHVFLQCEYDATSCEEAGEGRW
ncbi:potassium channel subfamily K member 15-like [Pomacea canaliculata]|uniref:potassium channel subfamily K member 15-like n=1 Tax=Pomacea canaliculata TaxID=400727 RepID=UPI000D73D585|nr:potassium channel subfamily K member 15-like [Pomacea canaliculata]